MFEIFRSINVDWMGKRKIFISVSIFILLAGLISAIGRSDDYVSPGGTNSFNLGVDFKSGTVVKAKFREKPSIEQIRGALQTVGIPDSIIQDSDKTDEMFIKIPILGERLDVCPETKGEAGRCFIKKALDETVGKEAAGATELDQDPEAKYKIVGTDAVGPVAGESLRKQAIIATLLGLAGILLFIAFRYDWTYAAGAVIAVFHDVLITLAFFSVFQWEINLTVIAALLTLVGFSVNDSIVIFDRIRENLGLHRDTSLYQLTNDSINQTMSRTIVTNGLVFLSVLALVIFGGEVLRSFSLALFVGSITGTYSTIAIASPIAIWWQEKLGAAKIKAVEVASETNKMASAARRSVKRKSATR
jgi:preprotein translocase subunit SecF